jgi:hypothetical protein
MKQILLLMLLLPGLLPAQDPFPTYQNGEGFPLEYLHPEYGAGDSTVLWIPSAEFFHKYGWNELLIVDRESENHGGGMHHSWNLTSLEGTEEGFEEAWLVHYDTTFWNPQAFIKALPELAEPRYVNGSIFSLEENGFLDHWGFQGYGSGFQFHLATFPAPEGDYLYAYRMEEYQEAENELSHYWLLNSEGLPQKKVGMEQGEMTLLHEYVYDPAGNFIGYKGQKPFVDLLKSRRPSAANGYQIFTRGQTFEAAVKKQWGYFPDHLLLGFWRFGYVHFAYAPKEKKYVMLEIVPFF